jgi:hypothetical protein
MTWDFICLPSQYVSLGFSLDSPWAFNELVCLLYLSLITIISLISTAKALLWSFSRHLSLWLESPQIHYSKTLEVFSSTTPRSPSRSTSTSAQQQAVWLTTKMPLISLMRLECSGLVHIILLKFLIKSYPILIDTGIRPNLRRSSLLRCLKGAAFEIYAQWCKGEHGKYACKSRNADDEAKDRSCVDYCKLSKHLKNNHASFCKKLCM